MARIVIDPFYNPDEICIMVFILACLEYMPSMNRSLVRIRAFVCPFAEGLKNYKQVCTRSTNLRYGKYT